jgi:hypothetical protein
VSTGINIRHLQLQSIDLWPSKMAPPKKSIEQMGQSCPQTGPLAYPALYFESVFCVWFSVNHAETHRIRFQPQPAQT